MQKIRTWFAKEAAETKALLQSMPAVTMALFVISVIGMNLLANKSIDTGVSWLALDAGMLLSWLSFLTMDITVKRFGPKASIKLSFVAAFINLLLALVLFAAAKIPGVWGESFVDEGSELINTALDNTFAGTWYVVMGSTVAFLSSSTVNNVLNWSLGKVFKRGGYGTFAARSFISTMVGQFVDNFLFAIIVSLNFFGWSILQCVTCSITGMVFELLCEVVFSPIGYRISRKWERDNVGEKYINIIAGSEAEPEYERQTASGDLTNGEDSHAQTGTSTESENSDIAGSVEGNQEVYLGSKNAAASEEGIFKAESENINFQAESDTGVEAEQVAAEVVANSCATAERNGGVDDEEE